LPCSTLSTDISQHVEAVHEKVSGVLATATATVETRNKAVPLHAMMALGGRGGVAPTILDLGTRWGEWSASRPGRALPRGKDPRYPLDRRLGGLQSRSGRRGWRKNYFASCG